MRKCIVALALIVAFCGVARAGSLDQANTAITEYKATLAALTAARAGGNEEAIAKASKTMTDAKEAASLALVAAAKDKEVTNAALEEAALTIDHLETRDLGWALSAAAGWRYSALKDDTIAKKHKDAALAELAADIKRIWATGILYTCWYAGALNEAETLIFARSCAKQQRAQPLCGVLREMPPAKVAGAAVTLLSGMNPAEAKVFLAYAPAPGQTIQAYMANLNAAKKLPDADALKFFDAAITTLGDVAEGDEAAATILKDLKSRKESLEKAAPTQQP